MIIQIFQVLLLVSASALCISLIIYIARISKSFEKIHADISRIVDEIRPILDSIESLTQSINKITASADEQMKSVSWIINTVKSRVVSLLELESKIRGGIEGPVQHLTTNLNAVKKGIAAFVQRLKI